MISRAERTRHFSRSLCFSLCLASSHPASNEGISVHKKSETQLQIKFYTKKSSLLVRHKKEATERFHRRFKEKEEKKGERDLAKAFMGTGAVVKEPENSTRGMDSR